MGDPAAAARTRCRRSSCGRGATCKRQWVLDADLPAAFDQIDHPRLLDQLGTFAARGMISAWLTAGVR